MMQVSRRGTNLRNYCVLPTHTFTHLKNIKGDQNNTPRQRCVLLLLLPVRYIQ